MKNTFWRFLYAIFLLLMFINTGNSNPKVILKLDDLYIKQNTTLFSPVMNFLVEKKIKFSAGIIAGKCDNTTLTTLNPYLTATNDIGEKLIEIYHHGLNHSENEYFGKDYSFQKLHFDSANNRILSLLKLQMHTFGSPYNTSDTITNKVVLENKNYKIFFLNRQLFEMSTGVISITHRCEIENGTGNPEYNFFIANYNECKNKYNDYILLQGNPNAWDEKKLEQFKLIIQFLITEGCEFILPYEYYLSLNLYKPVNLKTDVLNHKLIKLTWENKEVSFHKYKIERSTDFVKWNTIGICTDTCTFFFDETLDWKADSYYYRIYTDFEQSGLSYMSGYSNIAEVHNYKPPKIFIKLDDLFVEKDSCPFIPAMDFLTAKKVKFSAGIMAARCDKTTFRTLKPYLDAVDDDHGEKLVEIFNHGYDHRTNEFFQKDYLFQKYHFDSANLRILSLLELQMHTFGTPGNANDTITNIVISENENYKIFLLNKVNIENTTGIISLKHRCEIENGTGNPEYNFFVKNYNVLRKKYKDYLLLQGHPNSWDENKLEQFKLIVEFLISEGCEFTLPYEYFLTKDIYKPVKLEAENIDYNQIKLTWDNLEVTPHKYKIERTIDFVKWDTIGICNDTCTSFIDELKDQKADSVYYRIYTDCGKKPDYTNRSGYSNFIKVYPYKPPKVFIKFDDIFVAKEKCLFIPVMNFLLEKKVKFSAGIIADRCDNTTLKTLSPYLNAKNDKGEKLLEIFHHGYDHSENEFFEKDYSFQKLHFDLATKRIFSLLQLQMNTFGSPYNANDTITNKVVSEDQNYKIFFLNKQRLDSSTGVISITHRCEIENGTGNPEYDFFLTNFNECKSKYRDYILLQGHPNAWDEKKLDQFKKIVEFLINVGCEFVLPYEYYLGLNLYKPVVLEAEVMEQKQVKLNWNSNETSPHKFRIERSNDFNTWDTIAIIEDTYNNFIDKIGDSKVNSYFYRIFTICGIKSGYSNLLFVNNLNGNFIYTPTIFNISQFNFDYATVSFRIFKTDRVNCTIYNINGSVAKTLFSKHLEAGFYKYSYNLSGLKAGLYICNLTSSSGSFSQKFVVQ